MTIDEELQAALDVDPSPAFIARVRTRIANEPAPRSTRSRWWLAAAVAVAAVLTAAIFVPRAPRTVAESHEQALASRALPTLSVPDVFGWNPPAATQPSPRVVFEHVQSTSAVAHLEDHEILLDPRETAALRRLIFGDGAGRIDLKAILKPSPLAIADPAPVIDIDIPELIIEPLPNGSEGARQ